MCNAIGERRTANKKSPGQEEAKCAEMSATAAKGKRRHNENRVSLSLKYNTYINTEARLQKN